jgi:hypothetical protein
MSYGMNITEGKSVAVVMHPWYGGFPLPAVDLVMVNTGIFHRGRFLAASKIWVV